MHTYSRTERCGGREPTHTGTAGGENGISEDWRSSEPGRRDASLLVRLGCPPSLRPAPKADRAGVAADGDGDPMIAGYELPPTGLMLRHLVCEGSPQRQGRHGRRAPNRGLTGRPPCATARAPTRACTLVSASHTGTVSRGISMVIKRDTRKPRTHEMVEAGFPSATAWAWSANATLGSATSRSRQANIA